MGKPKPVDPIPTITQDNPDPSNNSKNINTVKKEAKKLKICSWNIRRGLVIRETELKEIIKEASLNIIFLVETDTIAVNDENDTFCKSLPL